MMNDPLPNTLSALIMVAVNDARKLNRQKHIPNSLYYHAPDKWSVAYSRCACLVCDAGAVMAGTLQTDTTHDVVPGSFPHSIETKLHALDLARQGSYVGALIALGVENININGVSGVDVSIHHNYRTWKQFDKHMNVMEKAAQQLEELGY